VPTDAVSLDARGEPLIRTVIENGTLRVQQGYLVPVVTTYRVPVVYSTDVTSVYTTMETITEVVTRAVEATEAASSDARDEHMHTTVTVNSTPVLFDGYPKTFVGEFPFVRVYDTMAPSTFTSIATIVRLFPTPVEPTATAA
jgi:hypothetical protein